MKTLYVAEKREKRMYNWELVEPMNKPLGPMYDHKDFRKLLYYDYAFCMDLGLVNLDISVQLQYATDLFKMHNIKAIIQESSLVITEFLNGILMIWKHFSSSMVPS